MRLVGLLIGLVGLLMTWHRISRPTNRYNLPYKAIFDEISSAVDSAPESGFRGLRFGENAQKRAHFVIFQNLPFCRENRVQNGGLSISRYWRYWRLASHVTFSILIGDSMRKYHTQTCRRWDVDQLVFAVAVGVVVTHERVGCLGRHMHVAEV